MNFRSVITKAGFMAIIALVAESCYFFFLFAQRHLTMAAENTYDIIIVPGIPLIDGKWDSTMKARVYL